LNDIIKKSTKLKTIIFIDDLDLISKEKKMINNLCYIFDDLINENIIIISCTNDILKIDEKLKRPGRYYFN
jgi:hypothetical protein